jgi:acyl-coenzyme A thioesterase PaaI-like protein
MNVTSALSSLDKDGKCFVCGQRNPVGLRMVFRQDGDVSRSEFTPEDIHVSWAGLFHGGLMTAVLDEAIGWVLFYKDIRAMTAKMEVRFRQPVLVGQRLNITGEITRRTRKIVNARAFATFDGGEVAAELDATMFVVNN